jgi:hypothetical protein
MHWPARSKPVCFDYLPPRPPYRVLYYPAGEDDAAFWNRLIPEEQRPKAPTEVVSAPAVQALASRCPAPAK